MGHGLLLDGRRSSMVLLWVLLLRVLLRVLLVRVLLRRLLWRRGITSKVHRRRLLLLVASSHVGLLSSIMSLTVPSVSERVRRLLLL